MTTLIDDVDVDTESSEIVATGPIVVTVTGHMPVGKVDILVDIGGGYALAYRHVAGDPTSLARLEIPDGASFKAVLDDTRGTAEGIKVDYVDA